MNRVWECESLEVTCLRSNWLSRFKEERSNRSVVIEEYNQWPILEKTSWREKSRELQTNDGDKNTKFFHKIVNAHKTRNGIQESR